MTEPEQWADSPDVTRTECDRCGRDRPCIWSDDPYLREIDPEENEEGWWCMSCYDVRAGDA